jgi:MoxR-like ATPase
VDRFLLKLKIGYPSEQDENDILVRFERDDPLADLQPVTQPQELLDMQRAVRTVRVEESVRGYVVQVARATRDHPAVSLGVSPRGTMALYHTAQARAAIQGREYVIPDDVKTLAPHVLTHRIIINPQTRLRGRTSEEVVMDVVDQVPVPVESL